ncbi:lytic transglycosylase domain-containing protein [Pandoraea pnomenusa]|uniref:lytic transglycosylase domain-containing protein n=1 Tax=Pandoraea pnomenusa TaxID=93220 RepID=UPI00333E972C
MLWGATALAAFTTTPMPAQAIERGLLPFHPRVADAQLVVPEPRAFVGRPLEPLTLPDIAIAPEPVTSPSQPDARPFDALIQRAASATSIDAALLHAIIDTESGYDPQAVSVHGAIGLMQVLPLTGQRFGVRRLEDPEENLRAGTSYLQWLLKRFDGDVRLALAAYNAGEGAVLRHGHRVPPFPETQQYVRKVMAGYSRLRDAGAPQRSASAGKNDTAGRTGAGRADAAAVARDVTPLGAQRRRASLGDVTQAPPLPPSMASMPPPPRTSVTDKSKAKMDDGDTSRAWRLLQGLGTWLTHSPSAGAGRDRPAVLMPPRESTPRAVVDG